jgi:hypothetical protein
MLNYIERELRRSGKEGPARIASELLAVLGKDIAFPSERTLNLEQVIKEYKENPNDPQLLTDFMFAFWTKLLHQDAEQIFTVDAFPLTSKEIKEKREKGYMPIFVPVEVDLVDLGRMFPKMGSRAAREGNSIVDVVKNSGWLWIEASIDAPKLDTTQGQLEKKLKKEGKQGQSLRTYIAGGQISKLLTDKYFDQGPTWSRLLGSCHGGKVLHAYFDSDGRLNVHSHWRPGDHRESMGGRSEEVIKA